MDGFWIASEILLIVKSPCAEAQALERPIGRVLKLDIVQELPCALFTVATHAPNSN